MRSLLNFPIIYDRFQALLGFSGARKRAFDIYIDIPHGAKIIDIGCGPGNIIRYLPENIDYHGFDLDAGYIESARKRFGGRHKFYCRAFDDAAAEEFGPADFVMLNGVLHHMDDAVARSVLQSAKTAAGADGRIFTLDGCYREDQSVFIRKLLDMDRGQYVRDQAGYTSLMGAVFERFEAHLHEDLSPIPYTFIIMVGRPGGRVGEGRFDDL